MPPAPDDSQVPYPDTADLRTGAPLHDDLLALLPLVGVWRGSGVGVGSDGVEFAFGQRVVFTHDGRAFLAHGSRTWRLDADGVPIGPGARESGFWRPGADVDTDVQVVLADDAGRALTLLGVAGDRTWELTATAERRLYAVRPGGGGADELAYVIERAVIERAVVERAADGPSYLPYLNARLARVPGPPNPVAAPTG